MAALMAWQTALISAAKKMHEPVVKALLASDKVTDVDSALFWADRRGYEPVIEALLASDKIKVKVKNMRCD